MLPVTLYPALCLSRIPIYSMCCSVLLLPTLQCLAQLCATRSDLLLSVPLLQYLGSMSLFDTKICPNNTEGLILYAKTTDEHVQGRDTLQLILPHAPPHHLNYSTKNQKRGTEQDRALQVACCSMLPVTLYPALCLSRIPIYSMCCSVLLLPTLQCLAQLCATRSDLLLSVPLLQYLGSMSLFDTKICPNNTEGLILYAKTTDEHVQGRDTLQLILPHAPPHHLNYSTKNQKMDTTSSRLLEQQQAQTNTHVFLHCKPSTNG